MPFVELLRPLTAEEFTALRADIIAVRGVQQAITTAITPNWGRVVVDGGHRATIAEELGLDVLVTSLGDLSAEKARDRCLALNVIRRHLTAEEKKEAIARRVIRVVADRQRGESLRTIGKREGVAFETVRRDLETVAGTVTLPTHFNGSDGRVYHGFKRGTHKRTAPTPPQRAVAAMKTLDAAVRAILRSRYRTQLEMVATALGSPIAGEDWPALNAIREILRTTSSDCTQRAHKDQKQAHRDRKGATSAAGITRQEQVA
jgi:ParB-like chromosome segregation protein Spo0J